MMKFKCDRALPSQRGRAADTLRGVEMNAAEIKVAAQRWYEREVQRAAAAHGMHWAANQQWVDSYLRTELTQHLAARGWSVGQ